MLYCIFVSFRDEIKVIIGEYVHRKILQRESPEILWKLCLST